LPSRSLFYAKTAQGECNGKGKAKDFHFTLPSRSLFYANIGTKADMAKSECALKHYLRKAAAFFFFINDRPRPSKHFRIA